MGVRNFARRVQREMRSFPKRERCAACGALIVGKPKMLHGLPHHKDCVVYRRR